MVEFNSDSITILCQEFDKVSDKPPIIYVVKRNINEHDLFTIRLRGMYNPELCYYATRLKGTDDDLIALANGTNFREPYFIRIR